MTMVNLHHVQVACQATVAGQAMESAQLSRQKWDMANRKTHDPDAEAKRQELVANQIKTLSYLPDWLRYRGLGQKHIANTLEVSEGTVSRYMSGKALMSVGHLRKIAFLLQCKEGDLLAPPPAAGLGPLVEETLSEMERMGPERWRRILDAAKDMKGKSD